MDFPGHVTKGEEKCCFRLKWNGVSGQGRYVVKIIMINFKCCFTSLFTDRKLCINPTYLHPLVNTCLWWSLPAPLLKCEVQFFSLILSLPKTVTGFRLQQQHQAGMPCRKGEFAVPIYASQGSSLALHTHRGCQAGSVSCGTAPGHTALPSSRCGGLEPGLAPWAHPRGHGKEAHVPRPLLKPSLHHEDKDPWAFMQQTIRQKRRCFVFQGVHTRNEFGKTKVLCTCTPAHPAIHLAGCSSMTCSSAPPVQLISNSIPVSMFQCLLKHQWACPVNEMRFLKKGKKESNILIAVQHIFGS